MKFETIVCLAMLLIGNGCVIRGDELQRADLKTEQRELCALLAKASPNTLGTNSLTQAPRDKDFSPYLTASENERMRKLLRDPDIAKAVTREQALAAIRQRETDGSWQGFPFLALIDMVNQRWPHDAVVIAFYREALATRGDEAIVDVGSPLPGVWDDSLLEPVIEVIEKTTSWVTMETALGVLNRHYSTWGKNATIPPRLSKAVLRDFPLLFSIDHPDPKPGDQMWCNAVGMLADSHDAAMVPALRPFLNCKAIAGDGSLWSENNAPVRVCDQAAFAIKHLLGDKDASDRGWETAGGIVRQEQKSYPKWEEWDKKIADLQRRLDAMGKP